MQRARERTAAAATSNDRRPILQAERARLSASEQTNKQATQVSKQNKQTSGRANEEGGVQGTGPPVGFGCAGPHGSATSGASPLYEGRELPADLAHGVPVAREVSAAQYE
jgi:hypothetical protein